MWLSLTHCLNQLLSTCSNFGEQMQNAMLIDTNWSQRTFALPLFTLVRYVLSLNFCLTSSVQFSKCTLCCTPFPYSPSFLLSTALMHIGIAISVTGWKILSIAAMAAEKQYKHQRTQGKSTEKNNSISTSNHVLFCLSYKHNSFSLTRKIDFINEWK